MVVINRNILNIDVIVYYINVKVHIVFYSRTHLLGICHSWTGGRGEREGTQIWLQQNLHQHEISYLEGNHKKIWEKGRKLKLTLA